MKQFNLDEYLKNPDRRLITKDGRSVRIICTNKLGRWPIVALISDNGEEVIGSFTTDGKKYIPKAEVSLNDLFFAPEMRTGWINIYHYDGVGNANTSRRIFNTKEEAIASESKGRIDTIKIEWEE